MQDIDFKEKKEHGDVSFPFAFYHVTQKHPRYIMAPHWHEECEICRVLSGDLYITIDGITYHGKGHNGIGDIFFINSGSLHSAEPVDCVYECVVFDMHFLLRERSSSNSFLYSLLYNQRKFVSFFPAVSSHAYDSSSIHYGLDAEDHDYSFRADIKDHSRIKSEEQARSAEFSTPIDPVFQLQVNNVIYNLFLTLRDQRSGYQLKTFGLMYYLIGLFEDHDLFVKPDTPREAVSRIMKMRLALSYIHRNYRQNISLNDLSELLDLKPPSVVKLFRDIINKRPMEYINGYRIHCAMEMLKNDKNSVTSVAFDCGFSDVSYFSKVFKKYAGKTPREYLKMLNKEVVL